MSKVWNTLPSKIISHSEIILRYPFNQSSLVSQTVKNLPAMRETWGCWEDSLEEGVATHSNMLVWRIPMDRGACPWGCKELDTTEQLSTAQHQNNPNVYQQTGG